MQSAPKFRNCRREIGILPRERAHRNTKEGEFHGRKIKEQSTGSIFAFNIASVIFPIARRKVVFQQKVWNQPFAQREFKEPLFTERKRQIAQRRIPQTERSFFAQPVGKRQKLGFNAEQRQPLAHPAIEPVACADRS
jgi:hypothetical protein